MRLDRHSKEVQAPQCDQQTQRTTARGNERTFREKLSQQTGAGSAQRCSDAKFLTSRGGPGQEQVDQVCTGDEQDRAHGSQHDAESGANVIQVVEGQTAQRGERRAYTCVRLGILLSESPADRVEARVRLSDRDAWA